MTELLEKGQRLALRIPEELKRRLLDAHEALTHHRTKRNDLPLPYEQTLSATARAAIELGLDAIEAHLKNGCQKSDGPKPGKKRA